VAFYGGNFLGLPTDYRQALLDEVQSIVDSGDVDGIRFSTRPDTITSETLDSLGPYRVSSIELGAQSMDDGVLTLSRRGHTAEETKKAVKRLRGLDVKVGVQIMPGLPGDTSRSILETGAGVAELQPDFVRIYPTVVVRDTVLERWYREGRFTPLSLKDAVELTKKLYLLFRDRGIAVIRMGLQATESLLPSGALVAGPFHPAFGHLVYSALFFDLAVREIEGLKTLPKRMAIKVHPRDVPKLRGLKNSNITDLVRRFGLEDLQVQADPAVSVDALKIEAKH
jgi:histone acetyltransferase (RNA polymerase elongator complex component)